MNRVTDPDDDANRIDARGSHGSQFGDHNRQDNRYYYGQYVEKQVVQPPAPPVAGSVVVGHVPQQPPAYQPREDLLAALSQFGPGVSVVQAVTGMRGVGKTQLAGAYARSRIEDGWRLVAWVDASNTATVLNGLAEVGARLRIGEPGKDLESIGAAVRNWLEVDGEQCLVVFDDVADLDGLRPYLPSAGRSQVVVTSTRQETSSFGAAVTVDVFSEDEALSFLARRTGRTGADGAPELARELGYLPLALSQAAAVIIAQRLDYPTYLRRLRTLTVDEYLTRTEGEPYPRAVAEAVLLSLDALIAGDPTGLCGALMDVISMLSTAGVSRAFLHHVPRTGLIPDRSLPEHKVDEALGRLANASLVTFSVDGSTVIAHRLIMRVSRERLAHDGSLPERGAVVIALLGVAAEALKEFWQLRDFSRDTVQQIMALDEHLSPHLGPDHADKTQGLLGLRLWAVSRLNELGDAPAQAIQCGESLVSDCERILGDTNEGTLNCHFQLGKAYLAAGRLDLAIPLSERTLADCGRIFGDSHTATLASRNDLGLAYQKAGRLEEAISLHKRTLTDRERIFGDTHAETMRSRNNLGLAYQEAGRLEEAIPLLERALAYREQTLGEFHPLTLTSRNNLANAYSNARRLEEAIPLHERTLAYREAILGDTHPNTLNSRGSLGMAYMEAGRLEEAIPLLERTLAYREQTLGDTHPDTLIDRDRLAYAYVVAGWLEAAVPLFERNVAGSEQTFGDTHPKTLSSREFLDRARDAVEWDRVGGLLAQLRQLLGPDDGPVRGA